MNQFAGKTDLEQFGVEKPSEALYNAWDERDFHRYLGQPTAEEIERVVRQSDVALTPREFVNKVPLIDRDEKG